MWEKDLLLSEALREELRHPFGVLLTGEEALAAVDECDPLVLVGDVVSHDMLRKGIQPKLVIYDGKTERRDMTDLLPIIERMRGYEGGGADPRRHDLLGLRGLGSRGRLHYLRLPW